MSVKARSTWVRSAATSSRNAYTLRCGAANISASCSLSAMLKVSSARQCNPVRWGRGQANVFHHGGTEDTEKKNQIREGKRLGALCASGVNFSRGAGNSISVGG